MSISLPLYLLLIPYGIFLLVFAFYAFFNLFQLVKHGINNAHTKIVGVVFVLVVGLILFTTSVFAEQVDWSSAFTIDTISPM